jgi:hypothetical protein
MPQADSPLEVMGRAASLQGMLQGNKMQQMQLDEATAAKKDQELLQQVWMEKGGDDDATLAEAPKRGVRMQTVRALQAQRAKAKKELFDMEDSERKAKQENAKVISSALFPLTQIPEGPEGDAALVQQTGRILQELVQSGVIPPKNAQEQAQFLQQPPAQIRQRVNTLAMMGVQADKQFEAINAEKKAIADAERKREERTAEEKNFQYEYQNYLAAEGLKPNAKLENDYRKVFKQNKTSQLLTPEEEAQKVRIAKAGKTDISTGTPPDQAPPDPTSHSILAQTGLSYQAFMALTGQMSQLSRDKATRAQALKEAQTWANKKGVDVSTLGSQYKTYNEVLSKNISRLNNTKIMEDELQGTIQNLQGVIDPVDLKARFANVVRVWAGQEVNDDRAQQYALHLYQLRNELAAYGAATQGRSGNEINLQDQREAETTIKNGVAGGSLKGLGTAIENSTTKMRAVMERSVDRSRKSIWTLFGVGEKYSGGQSGGKGVQVTDPRGVVHTFPNQAAADAFKKAAGIQ